MFHGQVKNIEFVFIYIILTRKLDQLLNIIAKY